MKKIIDVFKKISFKIDPVKGFYQLHVLWFGIMIIVLFSFFTWITIYYSEDLTLNTTSHGFNSFVEIFKVPLGILALIIPYIAFLATTHRSMQAKEQIITTREQINVTNAQNNFANYFKNLEEFEKYITSINIFSKKSEVNYVRNLHQMLYPKAKLGDYSISNAIKQRVEYASKKLLILENDFSNGFDFNIKYIKEITDSIIFVYRQMNLIPSTSGQQIFFEGEKYIFKSLTLLGFIQTIKNYCTNISKILVFRPQRIEMQGFLLFEIVKLDNIPSIDFQYLGENSVKINPIALDWETSAVMGLPPIQDNQK